MNKKLLITTAALLTAALGLPLSCHAESTRAVNSSGDSKAMPESTKKIAQATNVIKVGEYQSDSATRTTDTVIARVQPYEQAGRQVVTLYVRDIPVLTFSGQKTTTSTTKVGSTGDSGTTEDIKVATTGKYPLNTQARSSTDAPIWRATALAAKINQMSLDNVDANSITVSWKGSSKSNGQKATERYSIKVKDRELIEINAQSRLAEPTKNLAEDALQATNRLRRLLGNAKPLREVAGMPKPQLPKPPQNIALGPVRFSLSGLASWYGPGFHGRRSANGEVYNQNALTAAHKSLPFGTRVRVTHVRTGRSVVVRINDRGPYVGGRIIDLSAAAARIIGVAQTGVAPVRVEVLGR